MSVWEDLTVCDFLDIIDSWKLVGWGKMGFKAQTCWTDLLAFRGVWNRSRILNFGPDRLFFRFSRALTGKYYKDVVLKKLKKYYQKRCPATGFKHVRLLHDNAPAHTSAIVTAFLKKEKVTVLPHPPYSPDLAPCDFFLFPKLKAFLAGQKYQSRQALGSAIHQYLITVPKSAYRDAFKKWIHRLKLCISSHGEYFEGMKWVLLG